MIRHGKKNIILHGESDLDLSSMDIEVKEVGKETVMALQIKEDLEMGTFKIDTVKEKKGYAEMSITTMGDTTAKLHLNKEEGCKIVSVRYKEGKRRNSFNTDIPYEVTTQTSQKHMEYFWEVIGWRSHTGSNQASSDVLAYRVATILEIYGHMDILKDIWIELNDRELKMSTEGKIKYNTQYKILQNVVTEILRLPENTLDRYTQLREDLRNNNYNVVTSLSSQTIIVDGEEVVTIFPNGRRVTSDILEEELRGTLLDEMISTDLDEFLNQTEPDKHWYRL